MSFSPSLKLSEPGEPVIIGLSPDVPRQPVDAPDYTWLIGSSSAFL